jgi:hypothetical protein
MATMNTSSHGVTLTQDGARTQNKDINNNTSISTDLPEFRDEQSRPEDEAETAPFQTSPRFWVVIIALCFTAVLSALEGTIVSNALPTVIGALGGGEQYLWAVNGYFLPRYYRTHPTHWRLLTGRL